MKRTRTSTFAAWIFGAGLVLLCGCGAKSHSLFEEEGGDGGEDGRDGACGGCSITTADGALAGCDPNRFLVSVGDGRARVAVDMDGCSELELEIVVCDPYEWVLNVGDSPSNNGGGGDGSDFSNDAELQILGTTLSVFGNDYTVGDRTLLVAPDFVAAVGCTSRTIVVRDGVIDTDLPGVSVVSANAIRFDRPDDEGEPDATVFVGLNRVVSGGRWGSGLMSATLTAR